MSVTPAHRASTLAILLVFSTGLIAFAPPSAVAVAGSIPVEGVVIDDAGEPVGGVIVEGYSSDGRNETRDSVTTNKDGTFVLRLGPGKASANARSDDYQRYSDSVTFLVEDNTTSIKLVLPRPPAQDAIVAGVVRDSAGKPVEGAVVSLNQGCCYWMTRDEAPPAEGDTPPDSATETTVANSYAEPEPGMSSMPIRCCYNDYQQTRTDAQGRYSFDSVAGPRQVTAEHKGHARESQNVEAVSGKTVTVDFNLEKVPDADAILKGRVVDSKTGLPIKNSYVSVSNIEWSRYHSTEVKPDGSFEIATIPGWIQISIWSNDGCCEPVVMAETIDGQVEKLSPTVTRYHHFSKTFQLNSGENKVHFRLLPKDAPTIVLTGYVVDPVTKKAVPGAHVSIWNQDTSDWGAATTDATGSYKLLVRPGYHQVSGNREGYLFASDVVNVEPGAATVRYDLQMRQGTQKYAPCDSCNEYDIAYTEARSIDTPTMATPTPGPSSDKAMQTDGGSLESRSASGAQSYQGSGGGLPPYDPDETSSVSGATQNTVPAWGAVLGIAVLAVTALSMRRRD